MISKPPADGCGHLLHCRGHRLSSRLVGATPPHPEELYQPDITGRRRATVSPSQPHNSPGSANKATRTQPARPASSHRSNSGANQSIDGGSTPHGALLRRRRVRRYAGEGAIISAEAAARHSRAMRGDGAGADGAEDGVPRRATGARVHGSLRAQDGEVRDQAEAAAAAGVGEDEQEEGGVGLGLRELRGRVASRDGGADAGGAAGGGSRGAPLHAPARRSGAVPEALPADEVGVRVQRRAHCAFLPLARRTLRGHRGGSRWREAEEWGAHQEMQVPREQRVRWHVRQHVQDPHPGLLHQRVWTPPHHESKFRRHELRDDIRSGATSLGRGSSVKAGLLSQPLFHVDALCPSLPQTSVDEELIAELSSCSARIQFHQWNLRETTAGIP